MTTQTLEKPVVEEKEDVATVETTERSESATEVLEATDALLDEIDALVGDVEVKKPFTLADAIREGSAVTNQKIGNWTGTKGEVCALAAGIVSLQARGLA